MPLGGGDYSQEIYLWAPDLYPSPTVGGASVPNRAAGAEKDGGGGLCDNKINLHSSALMKVPRHLLSSLAASADDGFTPQWKLVGITPALKGQAANFTQENYFTRYATQPVPPTFKIPQLNGDVAEGYFKNIKLTQCYCNFLRAKNESKKKILQI